MRQISLTSIILVIVILIGCQKDLPCSKERYVGRFAVESISKDINFATIEAREGINDITLDINRHRYDFELDDADKCIATYKGPDTRWGLAPCGDMVLNNDKIEVQITIYILFIPLTSEYTLIF